jgi:hypothetical protein
MRLAAAIEIDYARPAGLPTCMSDIARRPDIAA